MLFGKIAYEIFAHSVIDHCLACLIREDDWSKLTVCHICGGVVERDKYDDHKSKYHPGTDYLQCPVCPKQHKAALDFLRHLRLDHSYTVYRDGIIQVCEQKVCIFAINACFQINNFHI
jgi:uncharacterized C2H2 Zn-finger protein